MAKLSYKVSYYVFYVLIALIIAVLGLFFLVGYNNPMGEYNAPENTETLIYFMYFMGTVAAVLFLAGVITSFVKSPKTLIWVALLAAVLVISYSIASSDALTLASGEVVSDASLLKLADMMIYSIYALITVAVVATFVNLSGILKK